jgi:hypothetical protein
VVGALLLGIAFAASATEPPLRAARWLPVERQAHALSFEPTECLTPPDDAQSARLVAIGRAAFHTPLLLGGQAARAGLACVSCHRNGRGNPDFQLRGVSGAPGTADVTSSLMSSKRGDGTDNPIPIPDLSGATHKISRTPGDPALDTFIRGLIVEEFDGPTPAPLTLAGVAAYVRALRPEACPGVAEQPIRLATHVDAARNAARAAQFALDLGSPATARLTLASARSELGSIDERYAGPALAPDRARLQQADLELSAIQAAIDGGRTDVGLRIAAWLTHVPGWARLLAEHEPSSLYEAEVLATALQR